MRAECGWKWLRAGFGISIVERKNSATTVLVRSQNLSLEFLRDKYVRTKLGDSRRAEKSSGL
jgi:hypothetical protein